MKKYKVLSLLTAAAIVITTTFTYAVWDSLIDETSSTVTFRNPVTITVDSNYTLEEAPGELDTVPTASGTVNFTVSNEDDLADTLIIVPTVSGGTSVTVKDFDFVIVDSTEDGTPKLSGDSSSGFVDESLATTSYKVQVTPKSESVSKIAGKEVNIQLTATLSKSN